MKTLTTLTLTLTLAVLALGAASANAAIIVTTDRSSGDPGFSVSDSDLANQGQPTFDSITDVSNIGDLNPDPGELNDGENDDGNSSQSEIESGGSFTINFDTTTNTLGYDITGISSYFHHQNTNSGGRATQKYDISLEFVDNPGDFVLFASGDWEPNTTNAQNSTKVEFLEDGGGTLYSDTISLTNSDGTSSPTGENVFASGVKAIKFHDFRMGELTKQDVEEFDVFGTAIPEPTTLALLGLGLAGLLGRRPRRRT